MLLRRVPGSLLRNTSHLLKTGVSCGAKWSLDFPNRNRDRVQPYARHPSLFSVQVRTASWQLG